MNSKSTPTHQTTPVHTRNYLKITLSFISKYERISRLRLDVRSCLLLYVCMYVCMCVYVPVCMCVLGLGFRVETNRTCPIPKNYVHTRNHLSFSLKYVRISRLRLNIARLVVATLTGMHGNR